MDVVVKIHDIIVTRCDGSDRCGRFRHPSALLFIRAQWGISKGVHGTCRQFLYRSRQWVLVIITGDIGMETGVVERQDWAGRGGGM